MTCEHWRGPRQVPCPPECPEQAIPADTLAGEMLALQALLGEAVDTVIHDHRALATLFTIWLLVLLTALTVWLLP